MEPLFTIRFLFVGSLIFGTLLGVMFQQSTGYRWVFWLAASGVLITFWDVSVVLQLSLRDLNLHSDPLWRVGSWAWVPLGLGCFFVARHFVSLRRLRESKLPTKGH